MTRGKIPKLALALASSLAVAVPAGAELNVVTTTADLGAIAGEVGAGLVEVTAIAKGTQDPHFIEAKPSFMLKASRADLLVAIGLDMEIGWLPSIIQGARNPAIVQGQRGFLEIGPLLSPIEIPQGTVTRAQGDVHPFGNPHVWLDPLRAGEMAVLIAARLGEIDAPRAAQYMRNAKTLQSRLNEKTQAWKARIGRTGITKIVSYHKTLNYFFARFGIESPIQLEPKPGIPPTSGHIMEVIRTIKGQGVPLILVENFFDPSVTDRIKQDVPSVRTATVAVSVGGDSGIDRIDDVYENLVKAIEGR